MSGHRNNSIALYLRPIDSIPPYQIDNCAKWLVATGQIKGLYQARVWINTLQYKQPWRFKTLMSNYYAIIFDGHIFNKPHENKYTEVNEYTTSNNNSYGNEPHMYK